MISHYILLLSHLSILLYHTRYIKDHISRLLASGTHGMIYSSTAAAERFQAQLTCRSNDTVSVMIEILRNIYAIGRIVVLGVRELH